MAYSKKVYVILINYNGWEDTIECLQSLINIDYKPINIIVIDNASKDDSIQNIIQWAEGNRKAKTENNDLLENIIIDKRPPILFSLLDENDLVDSYDVNNEMENEGQLFIIKSKIYLNNLKLYIRSTFRRENTINIMIY